MDGQRGEPLERPAEGQGSGGSGRSLQESATVDDSHGPDLLWLPGGRIVHAKRPSQGCRSIVTLAHTDAAPGGTRPEGASRVTAARTVASLRTPFERFVPRGAIVLSVLTFGSYVMGLVRDRILTRPTAWRRQLDTFNAAFQIPELLFSVIVASGLAAPFIPIFTNLERDGGTEAAYRFGQTILTLALRAMTIVARRSCSSSRR